MSESTLSVSLNDLRSEVGDFLGYGRTYASMSAAQVLKVDSVIKIGHRRFLNASNGYQWSFLRPRGTISIQAAYSTGTVTIVAGVVTLASGTFPTWAANGDLTVSGLTYSVNTRDSGTQVTLDDTSVTASAGTSYSIATTIYDLPADFGGEIEGSITFATSDMERCEAFQISEARIRAMKQVFIRNGIPQYFCILPLNSTTASTGQRYQIEFDSVPAGTRTGTYRYPAIQDAMTGTLIYPLGGMQHGDTILACIEAAAEERYCNIKDGPKAEIAAERMNASIARDKRLAPANMGSVLNQDSESGCAHDACAIRLSYQGTFYS